MGIKDTTEIKSVLTDGDTLFHCDGDPTIGKTASGNILYQDSKNVMTLDNTNSDGGRLPHRDAISAPEKASRQISEKSTPDGRVTAAVTDIKGHSFSSLSTATHTDGGTLPHGDINPAAGEITPTDSSDLWDQSHHANSDAWYHSEVITPHCAHSSRSTSQVSGASQASSRRKQDALELFAQVAATGLPNFMLCRTPLKTGLQIPIWRRELSDYSDKHICDFLDFGWPLGYTSGAFPSGPGKNHQSALAYPEHVQEYINKEVSHNAIVGPFSMIPFTRFHISPLMTREKKGTSDSRRVIMDLSFPHGTSVNTGIPKDEYLGHPTGLTYAKIDDLVRIILRHESPLVWKLDLK